MDSLDLEPQVQDSPKLLRFERNLLNLKPKNSFLNVSLPLKKRFLAKD
jgi:hypothetical protein